MINGVYIIPWKSSTELFQYDQILTSSDVCIIWKEWFPVGCIHRSSYITQIGMKIHLSKCSKYRGTTGALKAVHCIVGGCLERHRNRAA